MRKLLPWSIAVLACLALAAAPAVAEEEPVTLVGTVACAKCVLEMEGQSECQNVLIVKEEGEKKMYYLAKNETYDHLGEMCQGSVKVKATGFVKEEDGRLWLDASKIESMEVEKGEG
jgi:hypothetical protein